MKRDQIVVAGYCFGGMCALDLARSGADIAAAVSFHGLFDPPGLPPQKIKAKVVAFHGWDDPMVPPDKVVALGTGADRGRRRLADPRLRPRRPRLHQPATRASLQIEGVAYNALAAERSWTSFINLLEELFGGHG